MQGKFLEEFRYSYLINYFLQLLDLRNYFYDSFYQIKVSWMHPNQKSEIKNLKSPASSPL